MYTTCDTCKKTFAQRDNHLRYHDDEPNICVRCALKHITKDDEPDQEPSGQDVEDAYLMSGQLTPEDEHEILAEMRREDPGAFVEDDECPYCKGDVQLCRCHF